MAVIQARRIVISERPKTNDTLRNIAVADDNEIAAFVGYAIGVALIVGYHDSSQNHVELKATWRSENEFFLHGLYGPYVVGL